MKARTMNFLMVLILVFIGGNYLLSLLDIDNVYIKTGIIAVYNAIAALCLGFYWFFRNWYR